MKKIFLFSLSLIVISVLPACKKNTPEAVVTSFIKALQDDDWAEAAKYCDESTAKLLNFAASMASLAEDEEDEDEEEPKKEKLKGTFKVIETIYNEDKTQAEVVLEYTEDGNSRSEKIPVKKIDGDWKVNLKKEDIMKGEGLGSDKEDDADKEDPFGGDDDDDEWDDDEEEEDWDDDEL